jgi:phage terminase small subunit
MLTPKQQAFVAEYLVDLNASAAARRAGYSERVANRIGAENLSKPGIAAAIQAAMQARQQRTQVTADRVVQELARLGFMDVGKLVDADGSPLRIADIDEDTRRAIAGVEVVTVGNADVGFGQVVKLKLADKTRALEQLGRHLGIFERDNAQQKTEVKITGFRVVPE